MIVVVFGSREEGPGYHAVDVVLSPLHLKTPIGLLIHGACGEQQNAARLRGVDGHADTWAKYNEVPHLALPARWKTGTVQGKGEGPIRNHLMLDTFSLGFQIAPDMAIEFPGGKGTADMSKRVRARLTMRHWRVAEDGTIEMLR